LESLPGIGEATAKRIQEGRPWRSWDALDRLPGVGPATLEKWRVRAVLE
jgi:competence protein ComEA